MFCCNYFYIQKTVILPWFPPSENGIRSHLLSRQNAVPTFLSSICLHVPDFSLPPRFAHSVSPLGLCLSSYPNLLTSRLLCETSVKCCVLKHKGSHPLDLSLGNDDSLLWNPCKLPLSYRSSHTFYSLHMSEFSWQAWLCINHCINPTHIGDYN